VAHLFWGSLFEREIIQKLRLKIIQKFFADCKSADRGCRIANPTELLVGVPCGQKSFKIYTKSNKIGTLRVEIIQNLIQNYSKFFMEGAPVAHIFLGGRPNGRKLFKN